MRYVLLTSYDGTDFSGWQNQPGKRTVQSVMEEAASAIFGCRTPVTASGRTDAGVHALGQVAMLDAQTAIPPQRLAACFNRLLPPDVKTLKSGQAPPEFDVSRAAKRKTYCYRAYFAPSELPLFSRYSARLYSRPDPEKMRQAASLLVGEHNFAAFRSSGFTSKTSVREIYGIEIEERAEKFGTFYQISVTGNGFLYNMVRILSGELFAVGCGKEEGITQAFSTGDRKCLAKTMPPQGLTLMNVDYGVPLFGTEE